MFTNNLISLRNAAGLSQEFMAKNLAMTRATYIKLENGRKSPTLNELEKIAQIFEIKAEMLISNKAPITEQPTIQITLPAKASSLKPRPKIKFDPLKLENILLYVLSKVGAHPNIGETVLYKLLYFIDFDYYEQFGQPITGLKYYRNHYGPTPGSSFGDMTKAMVKAGELSICEAKFHNRTQKKYIAGIEADLRVFSGREIQHIDRVLSRLGSKTAKAISDLAHQDTPWIVTEPGKEIDYQLAKYRTVATSTTAEEDEL